MPGLQLVDAVSKGVLDGGHGIPAFWFGKNIAFGLYGAGPDFGMDANQLMGWVEYGGGKELFAEIQRAAQLNIVSYLGGPVPCEPMGWFKKEIKGPADLKGLKFRTSGLAVEMFTALGMSAVQMAPADIVPALDRGLLDGAEFASATDDRIMGFPDVASSTCSRATTWLTIFAKSCSIRLGTMLCPKTSRRSSNTFRTQRTQTCCGSRCTACRRTTSTCRRRTR